MNAASSNQILLIEDDQELAVLIQDFLQDEGFSVTVAHNAKEARWQSQHRKFALMICDLMLPDMHGFDLANSLLPEQQCPLIFLTALGDDETHLSGLQRGAVDFLTKPVKPAILLARIKLHLQKNIVVSSAVGKFGSYRYDDRSKLFTRGDKPIPLTNQEYDVLRIFIRHQDAPISRDFMFQQLVGRPYDGSDRAADLKISRLRKKLQECGCDDLQIKSLRSQGYVLIYASDE